MGASIPLISESVGTLLLNMKLKYNLLIKASYYYGSPGGTFLLITYYLLLITYHLLLITYNLLLITYYLLLISYHITGPRSAVSNVSGNRRESDCRSRGRKFDPGPVPYFRGD